ncbi:MAG: hypothetical protein ACUVXH_08915 [Anaerolineae bacterium]
MAYMVIIHLHNEDPILAEMDELPKPQDTNVTVTNPRRRDGKQVQYLDPQAVKVIFPWTRITFIEVFPSAEEGAELVEFFRE